MFYSRRLADVLLCWGVRGARRPKDALVTSLTTPSSTSRAFWASLLGTFCWYGFVRWFLSSLQALAGRPAPK